MTSAATSLTLRTPPRAQADGLPVTPGIALLGELRSDGDVYQIGFPSVELARTFADELGIEDVRVLVLVESPVAIFAGFHDGAVRALH